MGLYFINNCDITIYNTDLGVDTDFRAFAVREKTTATEQENLIYRGRNIPNNV